MEVFGGWLDEILGNSSLQLGGPIELLLVVESSRLSMEWKIVPSSRQGSEASTALDD